MSGDFKSGRGTKATAYTSSSMKRASDGFFPRPVFEVKKGSSVPYTETRRGGYQGRARGAADYGGGTPGPRGDYGNPAYRR